MLFEILVSDGISGLVGRRDVQLGEFIDAAKLLLDVADAGKLLGLGWGAFMGFGRCDAQ